jgi:hypothetical protein
LTTINAVESIYHPGAKDPHKYMLAGQLGDMIAYAQKVRYPLPVRTDRNPDIPSLLKTLESRDKTLFAPVQYRTDVPVSLRPEYVDPALQQFIRWSNSNAETLKKTVRFLSEPWIQKGHDSRVQFKYVYDLESISKRAEIELLARHLDTTIDMVCDAFDISLRYSLYGELAHGDHYLAHPIRDAVKLPTQEEQPEPPWRPCVSFAEDIAVIARKLGQNDFGAFLHELRGLVHSHGLHAMAPGEADATVVRKIASKLGLQTRFKNAARLLGVSGGLLAVAAGVPSITAPATVLGGAVAITAAVWRGHVPRKLGRWRWLRWMVRFDVEDQVKRRW